MNGIPYRDFNVEMTIAVIRKMQTATKDLRLKRGNPHNPCPLVHPFDSLVPKPTRNPETMNPR